MICPYCKRKIKDKSSYCIICGKIFYLENIGHDIPKTEKELLLIYYKDGKIPGQIHRISCGFLLFGFIYAFYKKMYVEGIISMITTALLLYFLGFGMGIIFQSMGFYFYCVVSIILLTAGINIYYLFNISYLRFSYIKTKIARIMMDYKDNDEIQKELCLKDSQNNWWAGIISVVVFIFILLILSIL